jgi:hypothetical protein
MNTTGGAAWAAAVRCRAIDCTEYYWRGERPRDPNAPQQEGTGEIVLESADRAAGHFTTRSDASANARTAGVYCRADPEDVGILDDNNDRRRAELIAKQLILWKSITSA